MIRAQEPERKTPGPFPFSSLKAQSQGKAQAPLQQPKADLECGMGWGGAIGLKNPVRSKDVCQPLEAFQLPQVGWQTLYVQCVNCVLVQEDCQPTHLPHSQA